MGKTGARNRIAMTDVRYVIGENEEKFHSMNTKIRHENKFGK